MDAQPGVRQTRSIDISWQQRLAHQRQVHRLTMKLDQFDELDDLFFFSVIYLFFLLILNLLNNYS